MNKLIVIGTAAAALLVAGTARSEFERRDGSGHACGGHSGQQVRNLVGGHLKCPSLRKVANRAIDRCGFDYGDYTQGCRVRMRSGKVWRCGVSLSVAHRNYNEWFDGCAVPRPSATHHPRWPYWLQGEVYA